MHIIYYYNTYQKKMQDLHSTTDRKKEYRPRLWTVCIKKLMYFIGGNLSEERFSPEPPSKDF